MQGRKSTRASVPLLPRYRSGSGFEHVEGQCLDISVGGMFIASSSPCETGTLLKFECLVDSEELPIKGVGRVVWQRANSGQFDRPSGMGLKFMKLEKGSAEIIERLIREAQLQGMTAPTHPLPASYAATDSFPPGSVPPPERLSAATRVSVVSTQPVDPIVAAEITGQIHPESQRVPAGTTPREPGAATLPAIGASDHRPAVVAASRVALLPGESSSAAEGSEVPAKLRAAARWISLALAVVVLAWTFLR
jgi:hypothetical protein